ncbi:hypothetical protein [Vulcanisaeta sp. EB80]|uniref:hypothetical protein n=1 Tax=Vulcanisaeta sp. EB80 TaxID=1650660 RepID=UPI00117D6288|nr:hypothetical protein [Vulcanisaeta sp. EB80]
MEFIKEPMFVLETMAKQVLGKKTLAIIKTINAKKGAAMILATRGPTKGPRAIFSREAVSSRDTKNSTIITKNVVTIIKTSEMYSEVMRKISEK